MATSVGAAAASGFESGIGLGLRMRAAEAAEEQQRRANLLQDEQLQRQREADKRLEDDRALEAVNKAFEDLRAEGEGYYSQFGRNVPEEIAGPYKQRVREVSSTRNELLRKRYEPIVQQRQQRAKDIAMQLQSGRLSIDDVAPADLYDAVHVLSRRNPEDLLSKDGKPSRLATAVTDFMEGIEFGNEGAVLRGLNTIFEPELKVGVGEPSPYGGTIVGKQIVKVIPHPANPEEALPVIKVYVRQGGRQTAGDVARAERLAEEGAPPDATGYYLAPVTENRSTDPNDPPKGISIQRAMEYAAQMQTLSTALGMPQVQQKLEEGRKARGSDDDFLSALYSVRGRPPARQVEYKTVKPGERLVGIDPTTGAQTGQVIEGPEKRERATGLAANIQAIADYAEERGISEAEAAVELQRQGLLRPPKAAGAGGKGGSGGAGTGGGKVPPSGVTGAAVLDYLSDDDATIVQGLVDGTVKPSEISTKDNRREKMLALAKRVDPNADFGPGGRLKDVPAPVQKAMLENNTNLSRVERAMRLVGALPPAPGEEKDVDPEATGYKGYLPSAILDRYSDPKGVAARAAIADLGSLVIHERSGAAVTAAEYPRLAPFIPAATDDSETVRKKLKRFREVYAQEMEALQSTYGPDNGYKPFRIGGGGGARPADTQHRQSGTVTEPAAQQPPQLPTDRKAAAEMYARLPSGATFIDPNGVTRRKP